MRVYNILYNMPFVEADFELNFIHLKAKHFTCLIYCQTLLILT